MSVFSARFGTGRFDQSRFDTLEGELSSSLKTISEKPSLKTISEKPSLKTISD